MQAEGGKRNTKHSLVGAKLDVNHFFQCAQVSSYLHFVI